MALVRIDSAWVRGGSFMVAHACERPLLARSNTDPGRRGDRQLDCQLAFAGCQGKPRRKEARRQLRSAGAIFQQQLGTILREITDELFEE
jgi:hypothetical protein